MPHIDYYFTVLSPYVYLAGKRLDEIAKRHNASVRYIPVHFGNLAARMGSTAMTDASDARKDWYAQDLSRQASKLGLPLHTRPTYWPGRASAMRRARAREATTATAEDSSISKRGSNGCGIR